MKTILKKEVFNTNLLHDEVTNKLIGNLMLYQTHITKNK